MIARGRRRMPLVGALLVALGGLTLGCSGSDSTDPGANNTPVATGSISGLVSDDKGKPLAGVDVETEPASGFAVSDVTGSYKLDGVAAGTYTLKATRTGFAPAAKSGVVVTAGGTALVDVTLLTAVSTGAIAGRVTDASTHAAIANATVSTDPQGAQGTSAADGSYRLESLAPGSYHLRVAAAGYDALNAGPVQVTSGTTASLDLSVVAAIVYESTCAECHVNQEKLLADLTIDPLPAGNGESGSTGEG